MAVSYRVIERIEPGVPGGGERKFYAKEKNSGRMDLPAIIWRVEKTSTLSGPDLAGMLQMLLDIVCEGIAQGKIVELGVLGNFRLSLKSSGHDSPEEVGEKSITGARVIFSPGPGLKEQLRSLQYKKV